MPLEPLAVEPMGDWNDAPLNKTRTALFGHNLNNAVIIGNAADKARYHAHAQMDVWGEDSIHFGLPGVTATDAAYADKRMTLEQGDLRVRLWHERAVLRYHPKDEFQSRLHFDQRTAEEFLMPLVPTARGDR